MADLDVQPKKRGSAWPWILLLLIIAVAAYLFLRNRDDVNDAVNNATNNDSTIVADSSATR